MGRTWVALLVLVVLAVMLLASSQPYGQDIRGRRAGRLDYAKVQEVELPQPTKQIVYTRKAAGEPARPRFIVGGHDRQTELLRAETGAPAVEGVTRGRFLFSLHGNFFAWERPREQPKPGSDVVMAVSFYRASGERLWQMGYVVPYDERRRSFFISDSDGTVVDVDHVRGVLRFHRMDGAVIDSVDIFADDGFSWNKGVAGMFTGDGRYFVAGAVDDVGKTFPHGLGILLFNAQGKLLWRWDADEPWDSASLWVSEHGEYILSAHGGGVPRATAAYLFDGSGRVIRKWEGMTIGRAVFSESAELIALLTGGQEMYLIQSATGEKVARLMGSRREVADLDVSEELQAIALVEGEFRPSTATEPNGACSNGRVAILNFDGTLAWEATLPFTETEGQGVRSDVHLSGNGEKIGVLLGPHYWVYQLVK